MDYEWDPSKARTNFRKHQIDFADASTIFSDEDAITIPDDYPDEERFVTIGADALGRVLAVVFTWRENRIRIISARKAERHERKQYKGKR